MAASMRVGQNILVLSVITVVLIVHITSIYCKRSADDDKPLWAKKDIRDYNEADMERLLDQWEEEEEPLEPDELPEHLRPSPKLDLAGMDMSNPESLLKLSKKGKTLMMFVTVRGKETEREVEDVTKLWQSSLHNAHVQCERYLIDQNRAIFMFKDGAQAWEAKDYILEQDECEEVVIENKSFYGKFSDKKTADTKFAPVPKGTVEKVEL